MDRYLSIEDYDSFIKCAGYDYLILSSNDIMRVLFATKNFCNQVGVSSPDTLFSFVTNETRVLILSEFKSDKSLFSIDCILL